MARADDEPARMNGTIMVICPRRAGRLVQAMGALAALRTFHKDARLIGLAHGEAMPIARELPYFDEVWPDPRGAWWDVRGLWDLRADLRAGAFARVYDFEQSRASRVCFHLLHGLRPDPKLVPTLPWCGSIPGTALYQDGVLAPGKHYMDRLQDQLRVAGVFEILRPDVSWAARQVREFSAPFRMNHAFAMLCLDSDTAEAWPTARFASLAEWLAARGLTPLLVGFSPHPQLAEDIQQRCPDAIDVTGKAPLIDTVFLAWAAAAAIGADSALMNLAAVANCRCLVLCGADSDPATTGPRGSRVQILHRPRLAEIAAPEILTLLGDLDAA